MKRSLPRLIAPLAALLPLLLSPGCGPHELTLPPDPPAAVEQPIVAGTPYNGHPSVGLLMVKLGSSGAICTATLVGKRTVLTAAHCVYPGNTHQLQLAGKVYTTTAVSRHPQYGNSSSGAVNDIALIRLNSAPPVTPSVVSRAAPFPGQDITIIGYGKTSTNAKDSGVKRKAVNKVSSVYSTRFTFSGSGGGEGNTCSGDSGGPAFAMVDGKEVHLGVHSMASNPCGSRGINTRTDAFFDWLNAESGGDLHEHKPDKEPPVVTIVSPKAGDEVRQNFTLQVQAKDDVGVTELELFRDGASQGKRSGGAASFELQILGGGAHTLKVEARDAAGNVGRAEVTVTVVPPKGYGAACDEHLDCISTLCAGDPYRGTRFCSVECRQGGAACPQDGICLPVAGAAMQLCAPAIPISDGPTETEGSCAVAPPGSPLPTGTLLGLAPLLALLALRRRRR